VTPYSPFAGAHMRWPFRRHQRPFIVRVVEPARYEPGMHGEVFNAAVTSMLTRPRRTLDAYSGGAGPIDARRFDLITFPEAFIDSATLLTALHGFKFCGPSGCVHVGLRPAADNKHRHLFTVAELSGLTDALLANFPMAESDLAAFTTWLADQSPEHNFNVGCIFLNDANGATRICLHPKLVRSKYELSPSREAQMHEANLISLVTLIPDRKELGTVTVQPLICSDALNLQTDAALEPPMEAVSKYAGCLGDFPPDHIDLVSVATCTPQTVRSLVTGAEVRTWHERYCESFLAAARLPAYSRHHFAAIVLANFQEIEGQSAGLSGVFLPVPTKILSFGTGTRVDVWGSPKDDTANRWSRTEDDLTGWRSRGFIASIEPASSLAARIFGFTINRLVRETSLWDSGACLVDVDVRTSARDDSGTLLFGSEGYGHE